MECKHESLGIELILCHRGHSTKEQGIDLEETDMPEIGHDRRGFKVKHSHVFELISTLEICGV